MKKFEATLGSDGLSRLVRTIREPETDAERDLLQAESMAELERQLEATVKRHRTALMEDGWLDPVEIYIVRDEVATEPVPCPIPQRLVQEIGTGKVECVEGWKLILAMCEEEERVFSPDWYRARITGLAIEASTEKGTKREIALYHLGYLERDAEWRFGHGPDALYGRKTRRERREGAKMTLRPDRGEILDAMRSAIEAGKSVTSAGAIAYRKGLGTSPDANRQLWSREAKSRKG